MFKHIALISNSDAKEVAETEDKYLAAKKKLKLIQEEADSCANKSEKLSKKGKLYLIPTATKLDAPAPILPLILER